MPIQPGSCEDGADCAPLACDTDSIEVCIPGMAALIGPIGPTGATGPVGATGPAGDGSGDAGSMLVPYYIPEGETFYVPEYKQALFAAPIESDGSIDVDGLLIEVD